MAVEPKSAATSTSRSATAAFNRSTLIATGLPSDAETRFVDASKLTVIPGLWESHTHEWISGKFYGSRLGRLWLAYGVTELQSQGDPVYRAVETREAYGSGERVGPRYFASGEAIDGERVYSNFMRPTMSEQQLALAPSRAQALDYDLLKTYVRLPHALQEISMRFAHEKMGVPTASHYMLPGMGYGMDGMTHVSATARLGFAYTRSLGGVSYQDMRSLFEASGMFVVSTTFQSFPLYAEDPGMVDDARPPKLLALRGMKLCCAPNATSQSASSLPDFLKDSVPSAIPC